MNFQLRMAENSEFSAAKQWRADADPADSIPKRIMNKGFYKLVYSRVRHMLVAVADFASAHRTAPGARRPATRSHHAGPVPALRALVLAAMVLIGNVILSAPSIAQIVAVPGSGAQVIQTQNGLPQVNISRPSSAGVSVNNYSQFDVQRQGAILNNAATITQTQQAGYVNGNPNLTPGREARIIVNQVQSNSPSQLRGYLEVAGSRAEVVVANPQGIRVDGAGFINTSRAVLTTGTPNFGPSGNLTGFNVTGGTITVQGAGLNVTNVDQVDLLSRAIQANAAIYANNLNVVAGANQIDHDTLNATPIAGTGPAPSVAIDVGALGGMYSNRIYLTSNEYGVGVSNRGILAAQAGDLTLKSNGQLVLAGTTNASGSMSVSARDGIDNSGVTYAQRDVIVATSGALTNSGTLAAQRNTSVNAGSVASTGTLGAGVNQDGTVAQGGDLTVLASGALNATGRNVAGGNATLAASSLNLASSQTAANGNVSLAANGGDLNLSGATTSAGGSINADATDALINDHGTMTAGNGLTLNVGRVSNQSGQVSAHGPLVIQSAGQIANQRGSFVSDGTMQVRGGVIANSQGTMQSAAALSVSGTSLDNTAGRIVNLSTRSSTVRDDHLAPPVSPSHMHVANTALHIPRCRPIRTTDNARKPLVKRPSDFLRVSSRAWRRP